MDIVYCSRCGKVIPPGGVDEGKYYAKGDDRICPACYRKRSAQERSGGTVLVSPLEEERRPPTSRIMPAARRKPSSGSSTRMRAMRDSGGEDQRTPTSRFMPAARRSSAQRSSSRLRALGPSGSGARFWIIAALIVAALAGVVLALSVSKSPGSSAQPTPPVLQPAGDPPKPPSPANPLPTSTAGLVNGAQFVSQNVPGTMTVGQFCQVSVTLKNSGTMPWSETSGHRLGSVDPLDNTEWGLKRIRLEDKEAVAPGARKAFVWIVKAPATPGVRNFRWRMVQGGEQWFGDSTLNVEVKIVPAEPSPAAKPGAPTAPAPK